MSKSNFLKLVAKGKIKEVIGQLLDLTENNNQIDLHDDILQLSARFSRIEKMNKRGVLSFDDYNIESNKISNTLKEYIRNDLDESTIFENNNINLGGKKKIVFISYNHKDKDSAFRVKETLEASNIDVIIDSQNISPGQEINEFIIESIRRSFVTLSIVSANSLLSAWVVIESIKTLDSEQIANKKFIGGYIDSSFFKRTFTDNALNSIENEILEIQTIIQDRLQKNRNIDDVQNELIRYNDLKHNLPKIIRKLKDSYTVDITPENYDSGIQQIINAII